jgi:glycosyltransferase involved in cell wall biosynthesis
VSTAGIGSDSWLKCIRQRASHAALSQDVSRSLLPPLRSRRTRLDAMIVPASRPASHLQLAIEMSALLGVFLVVLCSKHTRIEHVAEQVSRTSGARSLLIEISDTWSHPDFPAQTSASSFLEASAHRKSDLSAKRNIGLVLARLCGWRKIAFLDDDITFLHTTNIARLAKQLEDHQVAGMVVREYPDNSVVCHARRLVGIKQDVFVSGAVLGVRCNDRLSFFPDIYNEDWFYFARDAAARKLPSVGNARQAAYNPFIDPDRARSEEFGDLLAEGLYALFGRHDPSTAFDELLDKATNSYWLSFMDARLKVINESHRTLYKLLDANPTDGYRSSALNSLAAAKSHLKSAINPQLCVDFLDAWREDLVYWQKLSGCISKLGGHREAMEYLQLETWMLAEFGRGVVDSETAPSISEVARRETQPQPALEPSDSGQVLTLSS